MSPEVEILLQLPSTDARNHWLQEHYPSVHKPLVADLRSAAQLSEQKNPQRTLEIGHILDEVAQLWADGITNAEAHLVQANAHRLMGDLARSLQGYRKASDLYHQLKLPDELANVSIGEIEVHLELGDYAIALELADSSIEYFREGNDEERLGRTLMNRGNIYARMGKLEEALADYEQAKEYFSTLQLSHFLGMIEANQGYILEQLNKFRESEARYLAAQSYFDSAKMAHASAQIEHNLAYLAFAKGEYQQALQLFSHARTVFEQQNAKIDIAFLDLYRSEVYLALNLWDKAVGDLQSAAEYFHAAEMPWEEARSILNRAIGLTHLGELELARTDFDAARTIFERLSTPIWVALVDFYYSFMQLHLTQYEAAKLLSAQAYEVFADVRMLNHAAQCQINLGMIAIAMNNLDEARSHLAQALSVFDDIGLPTILYQYHYGMAQVYQKKDQWDAAQQSYLDAFVHIERLEQNISSDDYKISFRKNKQLVYESYILACLQQGGVEQHEQAFVTLERAKATILLSALERGLENKESFPAGSELATRIRSLQEELAWHYNRLFVPTDEDNRGEGAATLVGLVSERERLLSRLLEQAKEQDHSSGPTSNQPSHPASSLSVTDIQDVLPTGTVLIEYFVSEHAISVFVISQEGFSTITLAVEQSSVLSDLQEVQAQMGRFRHGQPFVQQHSSILLQSTQSTLQSLFAELLEPALEHIDATVATPVDALIIVPHGILHFIPFHALYDGTQYLLQRYRVSYAPSSAILCHLVNRERTNYSAPSIVMGLSDKLIPQAEAEVKIVANLFPAAQLHSQRDATSDMLLKSDGHIPFLHLASHALFRADNPSYSAIKLDDRWLTLHELEALRLRADLVILSACDTGLSQIHAGDELTGFYGLFFRKAAQALTLSLWQVDDSATIELMTRYYAELSRGAMCQVALHIAQLEVLSKHPHPYFWASFILTGNPLHCLLPANNP